MSACNNSERKIRRAHSEGEYIFRNHSEIHFVPPTPQPHRRAPYPWEGRFGTGVPKITKEYFRCGGNALNPSYPSNPQEKNSPYLRDCAGREEHGLPLRDGKEFVYPCLLEILNYIQNKTEKRVVITSAHRCPQHNTYCDPSPKNRASKHLLGAEVDFYVEGYEETPNPIIALIQEYYTTLPKSTLSTTFHRYEKGDLNVTTPPWYNQEIFVKLYLKEEGRNIDTKHTHPYIGIQVRYDRDLKEKVLFSDKQSKHYLRS